MSSNLTGIIKKALPSGNAFILSMSCRHWVKHDQADQAPDKQNTDKGCIEQVFARFGRTRLIKSKDYAEASNNNKHRCQN